MINLISFLDLISLLAALVAFAIWARGWRKALERDARWLFTAILALTCLHGLSNFVEWSGLSTAFDNLEDFLQLLWPMLWGSFFYVFLRWRAEQDTLENQMLSDRQAESVMNTLIGAGVDAGRIFALGYGDSRPLTADNGSGPARRVDLLVKANVR